MILIKITDAMREEYDIKSLNPRKNPYANKVKTVTSKKTEKEASVRVNPQK